MTVLVMESLFFSLARGGMVTDN